MDNCVAASEAPNGSSTSNGSGTKSANNVAPTTPAKPIIPPKPESFSSATLHRQPKAAATENGDARMKRAKSGEILLPDLQAASTLAANSKSPVQPQQPQQQHQSPRASKPPAPPIPSPRPLRPLEDGQSADPPPSSVATKSWAVFDPPPPSLPPPSLPPPSIPPPSIPPPPLPPPVRPDSDSLQAPIDTNLSVNSPVTRPAPAIPTEAKSSADAVRSLNGPTADPLRIDPPKLFSDPVKLNSDPIKPVLEPVKIEPLKPVIEPVKMEPARLSRPAVEPMKMSAEPATKPVIEPVKIESIKLEPLPSKAALEKPVAESKPLLEAVKPSIMQPVKSLINCIRPAPAVKATPPDASTPIIDPLTHQIKKDDHPSASEKNPAGSMTMPVIESLKMRSHQMATNSASVSSKDSASTTMTGEVASFSPSAPPLSSEETALIRAKPATGQQRSSILVIDIDSESMDQRSLDNRPPSLHPYSFRECWEKEVPENETKKEFYWRRFCEIMLMIVTCCIRCFGPV